MTLLSREGVTRPLVACATDETKLRLSPSAKQRRSRCSRFPPVYNDLSARHDWPVKNAIVDLPIRMKGNSKCTYDNSFSPLGAQNKNLVTALKVLQTVLTKVKLRLQRRLARPLVPVKIGINAARPSFSLPGSTPFNREGTRPVIVS